MSDSYNSLGTAQNGIKSGELPGKGNPLKHKKEVQVLEDYDNGTDEGRAMAEIIHDVAPAADMAFHYRPVRTGILCTGITALANAGCKVITDDIIYFAEPFFQDGVIAQAVDKVKQKGISYFASAGNKDVRSYESEYRSTDFYPFRNRGRYSP